MNTEIKSAEEILHKVAGDIYKDPNLIKAIEEYHNQFTPAIVGDGWISVEDRLPEKIFKSFYDKELNAWLTPTSIQVLGFDGELVYECSFTDEGEFWEFGSKSENITHWQPLPTPPNGKEQPIKSVEQEDKIDKAIQ